MTSSEGPFLVLPRAPPTLNPPLTVEAIRLTKFNKKSLVVNYLVMFTLLRHH